MSSKEIDELERISSSILLREDGEEEEEEEDGGDDECENVNQLDIEG